MADICVKINLLECLLPASVVVYYFSGSILTVLVQEFGMLTAYGAGWGLLIGAGGSGSSSSKRMDEMPPTWSPIGASNHWVDGGSSVNGGPVARECKKMFIQTK
ncbi:hypothetical protein K438DRAFT_1752558 [Mycena galopus ATCC 62051]|nr:hypothetical protein K438DRAFT_1752558 [Mycena galopus ATCC 62051]